MCFYIGYVTNYKTFKSNELDKAKKYRDNLVRRTRTLVEKANKLKGQRVKETKLKTLEYA